MKNMGHNGFSAKDICDILRACQKSSVKELKLGDMCVSFTVESTHTGQNDASEQDLGHVHANNAVFEPIYGQNGQIDMDMVTSEQQDEIRKFEENLTMIDDPVAYEQMIIDSYNKVGSSLDG